MGPTASLAAESPPPGCGGWLGEDPGTTIAGRREFDRPAPAEFWRTSISTPVALIDDAA